MKKKILLIDDDKDLLLAYKVLIENSGYEVITANNSKTGEALILNEKPDLAIFDVMMDTDFEGYELMHKVRNEHGIKSLPIIMLSGIFSKLSVNIEEKDGGLPPQTEFRDKPIDPIELLGLIEEMLK